ncbi:SCO6745 family protein [Jidongwangia harbinensis]|uniref:SCO6745 family protein n=1 Tax=Jidongwangia harbinensis TaxID=2878561 RepID=UPI001CDA0527|nr:hypothetical protein [Jidongwangia harbinensis]MCA2217774.1 hypothetical protein [Jidongwangia harbinensis]
MTQESPVRRAWRVTEPLHALIYFVPEAPERYAAHGIDGMTGYFASRAAALGPVGAGPVTALFYNFHPRLVARALPAAWAVTTPAAMLAARMDAADAALRRGLGDAVDSPAVAEAAALARRAAESAAAFPAGRPLYAAHAELPWPAEPHLVLFHAQTLLREFRGDGHCAALLQAGVTGPESLVLHVASGEADAGFLRTTRGWSADEWAGTVDGLRARGLLAADEPVLSDAGRELRAGVEAATDRLTEPAYRVLGEAGCTRLAELTRPLSRTVVKAGMLNPATIVNPRT